MHSTRPRVSSACIREDRRVGRDVTAVARRSSTDQAGCVRLVRGRRGVDRIIVRIREGGWWVTRGEGSRQSLVESPLADPTFLIGAVRVGHCRTFSGRDGGCRRSASTLGTSTVALEPIEDRCRRLLQPTGSSARRRSWFPVVPRQTAGHRKVQSCSPQRRHPRDASSNPCWPACRRQLGQ